MQFSNKLNFLMNITNTSNKELAEGWGKTRATKGRCGCFKHYMGTCIPSEYKGLVGAFGEGLSDILRIVKLDFEGKTL